MSERRQILILAGIALIIGVVAIATTGLLPLLGGAPWWGSSQQWEGAAMR